MATATRKLNSLVEQVRNDPTCTNIIAATAAQTFTDGAGATLTSQGTFTPACPPPVSAKAVTLTITATNALSDTLATVTAIVYVP